MPPSPIYLDNNASTRVDPRVIERMMPYFRDEFANPNATHRGGSRASAAIETAREQVAHAIHAPTDSIIFLSGGTEADNHAMRGVLDANPEKKHIIITAIEHHAVREPAAFFKAHGCDVTVWGVGRDGLPDVSTLAALIRPDTALVSAMLVNNEIGVILPIREIAEVAHACGVLMMSDGVNALGKTPIDVEALGVDLLALSAHKVHGPKGVGALYVRKGLKVETLVHGGPQERHRRGGTQNVPGIVGFGAACEILGAAECKAAWENVRTMRDEIERFVRQDIDDAPVMGEASPRVANTSCICFADCSAEALLMLMSESGIYASSGAACASGALEPSPILLAMGIENRVARGQIRFSLSRETTAAEIEGLKAKLPELVERARKIGGCL